MAYKFDSTVLTVLMPPCTIAKIWGTYPCAQAPLHVLTPLCEGFIPTITFTSYHIEDFIISDMSDTTVLSNVSTNTPISSQLLGTSLSSSSPSKRTKSLTSKIYKQASTLFLTRRLTESFATIAVLITPVQSPDSSQDDGQSTETAPVAGASRSTRVKVWNLYLAILNAIIDLGPEEGKNSFGSKDWKNLVTKVQEGTIWEDVVQIGYGGIEGNVDADVVINL